MARLAAGWSAADFALRQLGLQFLYTGGGGFRNFEFAIGSLRYNNGGDLSHITTKLTCPVLPGRENCDYQKARPAAPGQVERLVMPRL